VVAASYYELSRIYSRSNNYQEALVRVDNGLQAFDPEGERKSTKYVLLVSKVIYLEKLKRNSEAKSVLEKMRKYEGEMDTETKLNMYQSEVNLLFREKMYDQAIQKAKQAIDIARREKSYDRSFEMWTTLGSIYKDLGDLQLAKVCFETSAQFELKIKRKFLAAYNETEIGKLYYLMDNLLLAEIHLKNAVNLSKDVDDAFYQFEALNALSELWLQHGQKDEGIQSLEQAYQLAHKHGLQTQEKNVALKLAKFYKELDQRKYHDFLTRFYEISVKLSSTGGDKEMNFAQTVDSKHRYGEPPDN
jgi:tetratricopeptide (TPR) repeat protein